MPELVVSKKAIHLMDPNILGILVKTIESYAKGWWWSISQTPGSIRISLGPSSSAQDPRDVFFATTKEGDVGIIEDLVFDGSHNDLEILGWVGRIVGQIAVIRDCIGKTNNLDDITVVEKYRYQTSRQISILELAYKAFLNNVNLYESYDHLFQEIYIGSCEVSVDCSLRGTRENGSEFDISLDLFDKDDGLHEAFNYAVLELQSDILTPRENPVS